MMLSLNCIAGHKNLIKFPPLSRIFLKNSTAVSACLTLCTGYGTLWLLHSKCESMAAPSLGLDL